MFCGVRLRTEVRTGEVFMEASIRKPPLFTGKYLFYLIVPLMIEQVLAVTIGFADTIMVARVGESAVSAVALVDSVNILIIQIFAALATGGAVICSQYLGRKDFDSAQTAARQLILITGVAGIVLMVLLLPLHRLILNFLFGHVEEAVMIQARQYFVLSLLSYPFLGLYNSGAALFRSMGNSRISMQTALLMNIINIGGNAILIFKFEMGVVGAGTASLVSRAVSAIVILSLLFFKPYDLQIRRLFAGGFRPQMIRRILGVGIPAGVEGGLFQAGKLTVQRFVTLFGTAAIAANAVANTMATIANIPGMAISLAMITVVGQCMGAEEHDQAQRYALRLLGIVALLNGLICLCLFFSAESLAAVFHLRNEASDLAVSLLRVFAVFSVVFWPPAFSLPNALRAAGDVKLTMTTSIVSMFLFRIGLCFFFYKYTDFGVAGIWYAMYVDWICRSIVFVWRFFSGKWKSIKIV